MGDDPRFEQRSATAATSLRSGGGSASTTALSLAAAHCPSSRTMLRRRGGAPNGDLAADWRARSRRAIGAHSEASDQRTPRREAMPLMRTWRGAAPRQGEKCCELGFGSRRRGAADQRQLLREGLEHLPLRRGEGREGASRQRGEARYSRDTAEIAEIQRARLDRRVRRELVGVEASGQRVDRAVKEPDRRRRWPLAWRAWVRVLWG